MTYRITWSDTALSELRDNYTYIARDRARSASAVQDAVDRTVGRLAENPRLGRHGHVVGTRELVVSGYPSYIVVYEVRVSDVQILAVRHAARSWPEQFDR